MKNIKGIAVVTDGNLKRIAVTFDVVEEDGKISKVNQRINRVITDSEVLKQVTEVESYAQKIVDEQQKGEKGI